MGVFAVTLAMSCYGAGSGMSSGGSGGFDAPKRSPEQLAASSYNAGLKHKKRALSYEEDARAATKDKDRDKFVKRARDQFEDAVKDYQKAIGYDKRMFQAMNELGFAYRKLGDYENAMRAYNTALFVKADFAPAIEYRAEVLLKLGMFEETKAAYLELYRLDQAQAGLLMQAFDEWLASKAAAGSAEAKAFADWVGERKQVASVTQAVTEIPQRDW
jgi:tetratricopeptide (TPR) repeat protein